jgi:hypothetical protein
MASDQQKFFEKYHRALVMAVKDDLDKVKPRVASVWVNDWLSELGGPIHDRDRFAVAFESFLKDGLGFADSTRVTLGDGELDIKVEGCSVCPANESLRQSGEPTLCPILSTGLLAISRVLGERATLLGVDKGDVGYCTIRYRTEPKPA